MTGPEPQVLIAPLVSHVISSFGGLVSVLEGALPESPTAVSHFARFKLWAGSLGAHRSSGGRSLEYRLRDASSIKNHILSLLEDLCGSVIEGVTIATKTFASEELLESPGNSPGDSTDAELEVYFRDEPTAGSSEISRILDDIGHVVDCLLRLSITIRNPAPHDHFKSRAGDDIARLFEQWDVKHAHEKFPGADNVITERLGRAIARRRQYFKYREEHTQRLSEGLGLMEVTDEGEKREKATTIASSIPSHLKEGHTLTETRDDFAGLSDSESNLSMTSYAPSMVSSDQLRVPSLPKEHKDGPFKCPFCCLIVSINTRHEWKKHVFQDLRPYVCIEASCTTPDQQYQRRGQWIEHMNKEHWRIWKCPLGCSGTFYTTRAFGEHIDKAHPGLDPDTLESLGGSPDNTKANGQCTLCQNYQITSNKKYRSHIGTHLEQLALFALPNIGNQGDENDDMEHASEGDVNKEEDAESSDSSVENHERRKIVEDYVHAGEATDPGESSPGLDEVTQPVQSSDFATSQDPESDSGGTNNLVRHDPGNGEKTGVINEEDPDKTGGNEEDPRVDDIQTKPEETLLEQPHEPYNSHDTLSIRYGPNIHLEHFPMGSIEEGKVLVSDLRERLPAHQSFPADVLSIGMTRMFFNDQCLDKDNVPLRDYGVGNGSTVDVEVRLEME